MRALSGELQCIYPSRTQAVSITGSWCGLNCAHCGGHYLRHMLPLSAADGQDQRHSSWLISGGCQADGSMPLSGCRAELTAKKGEKKFNFHVGLPGEADWDTIAALADCVSFDWVTDEQTIREVYGSGRHPSEYLSIYRRLRGLVRTVPHICVGLAGGELRGEFQALDVLEREETTAIVFVVFVPTANTRFSHCRPPKLQEVSRLFDRARQQFPDIPLHLGCMRPGGEYRQALDCLAVQSGIDVIVQPTPPSRRLAEDLGLRLTRREECCAI